MQRVMILGQPGAGKSTLARRLGDLTGLPVFHIDLIHWKPGWVERSQAEKGQLCAQVHAQDRWIFEGGHSRSWPERLARCDTLIWLDIPLYIRLPRVIRRSLKHYGQPRPDLPENCPERLDPEFWKYIWITRRTSRMKMAELYAKAPPDKAKYRLQNRHQVDRFLDDIH
ncbi:AAA family ATPase [Pseudaestuariivita rosea]|uniref:AAA family ATPase n=1 Tax=Pseudaestuariivita rosea TaxID=2763263 RepID=UPI001ABB3C01|nr:AAA family ATPase [Pseudaestuariivita rosea]